MGVFRKNWEKVVDGVKQTRSIFSVKEDDLVFRCHCGAERIFGKKAGFNDTPDNQTPLLNCWNVRAHGITVPKLAVHTWVRDFVVPLEEKRRN